MSVSALMSISECHILLQNVTLVLVDPETMHTEKYIGGKTSAVTRITCMKRNDVQ